MAAKSAALKREVAAFQRSLADLICEDKPTAHASDLSTLATPKASVASELVASTTAASPCASNPGTPDTPDELLGGQRKQFPSKDVLASLFDLLCPTGQSGIGLGEMTQAIELLNLDYNFGLQADDAHRLMAVMLKTEAGVAGATDGSVSREQFVEGLSQLARALVCLGNAGFGLLKMKAVLVSVFERFDVDKDGSIDETEFMAGLAMLSLEVGPEDAACLHTFFSPGESLRQESLTQEPELQKIATSVIQGGMELLQERFNLRSFVTLMEAVGQALARTTGSPGEKAKEVLATAWEEAEDVCNVSEGAVEMASFAFGAQYCFHGLQNGLAEGMDVGEVGPLLILLGALGVKINKDLMELVPRSMTEDEALLYYGVFQKHGLSQASFCRLLASESCRWGVAEAGEVLSAEEEGSIRIIVKGPVAVEGEDGVITELPNRMLVGETTYLGGSRLWGKEAIVAQGTVTYIHWDVECLRDCLGVDAQASSCVMGLLTESMVSNFTLASSLRAERTSSEDQEESEELPSCSSSAMKSYSDAFARIDINGDGTISKEELRHSIDEYSYIFSRLGFASTDLEFDRVFSFLDQDGDGTTTREEFISRLSVIEGWAKNLAERDMSIGDLSFVLVRAHSQIDENGDGLISREEFWAAVQRLDLTLSKAQSDALHCYLDQNGDGFVDVEEWQASSKEVQVMAAMKDILSNHAAKKGLTRFAYFSRQMQAVLEGPQEPAEKIQQCLGIAWDGIESLGDVASLGLDVSGYLVAMVGISQQFAGLAEDGGGADGLDLAPFILLLGVSAVQFMRKIVEESASDLTDREALLYAKAFGGTGISVADFRKLLRHGQPRWESLPKGAIVMQPDGSDRAFHALLSGCVEVSDARQGGLQTLVGNGSFLCNSEAVCEAQGSMTAVVREHTMSLSWPAERLRPLLEHNNDMKMKLQRALSASMAKSLLQRHPSS